MECTRCVVINEGVHSEMGLEQRRQLKWSFEIEKKPKVWPVETDMWEPNRYCLTGKRETHSACAGTWIQPLAVSFKILYNCINIKLGIRLEVRGQQMLSCKVLGPTYNSVHVNNPRTYALVKNKQTNKKRKPHPSSRYMMPKDRNT